MAYEPPNDSPSSITSGEFRGALEAAFANVPDSAFACAIEGPKCREVFAAGTTSADDGTPTMTVVGIHAVANLSVGPFMLAYTHDKAAEAWNYYSGVFAPFWRDPARLFSPLGESISWRGDTLAKMAALATSTSYDAGTTQSFAKFRESPAGMIVGVEHVPRIKTPKHLPNVRSVEDSGRLLDLAIEMRKEGQ